MYLLKKKYKRLSSRHYVDQYLCPCGNIFDRRSRGKVTCTVCRGKYKKDVLSCYKKLYNEYNRSAVRRYLSFHLDLLTFARLASDSCFYCGSERMNNLRTKDFGIFKYSGLDRVDNNLGYSVDNCVSCCKNCNFAKRNMSQDEFLKWAKTIAKKDEERC